MASSPFPFLLYVSGSTVRARVSLGIKDGSRIGISGVREHVVAEGYCLFHHEKPGKKAVSFGVVVGNKSCSI